MPQRFQFYLKELTNAAAVSDGNPFTTMDAESRKQVEDFGPFNGMDFKNNSGTPVHLDLDGSPDKRFRVEDGQGLKIDPVENIFYRTFSVTRVNAVTINADEIRVQVQRIQVTT